VKTPLLSAANWGGQPLHPRGNFEGFVRAAAKDKWLEVHGIEHWTHFYTDYGVALQKRFLGHFLKGEDTGWDRQPPLQLQIRHPGEKFVERHEHEWPLARTQWTKFHLDPASGSLARDPIQAEASASFDALGDGLMFLTPPLEQEMEITGPSAAKLVVSSSTSDADLFVVIQVFAPDGKEVVFQGALDPHTPIAQGWLRASHRKLDKKLSTEYRPYHSHDEKQLLSTMHEELIIASKIFPSNWFYFFSTLDSNARRKLHYGESYESEEANPGFGLRGTNYLLKNTLVLDRELLGLYQAYQKLNQVNHSFKMPLLFPFITTVEDAVLFEQVINEKYPDMLFDTWLHLSSIECLSATKQTRYWQPAGVVIDLDYLLSAWHGQDPQQQTTHQATSYAHSSLWPYLTELLKDIELPTKVICRQLSRSIMPNITALNPETIITTPAHLTAARS
jgi:hypothetical protein